MNDGNSGVTWATASIDIERENRAPVITGVDIFWGNDATEYVWIVPHWDTGDPYYAGPVSVDDPHRVNGRVYAFDPDGDDVSFTVSPLNQPEHGVVFMNAYVDAAAPSGLDHTQLQGLSPVGNNDLGHSLDPDVPDGGSRNYFVSDYGAWQYVSWKGDGYSGSTSFVITATDSRGLSSTSDPIVVDHVPWSGGGGGCFPVVVDTGDDGIDLVKPEDSRMFADINGDGWRDQIGWVSSSDALLAYDANHDGVINHANEISFTSYLPGARTDLEGLAAFDSDGDGTLSRADAQWDQFGLLQDRNGNGVQDDGEWVALQAAGVSSINLSSDGLVRENNGNVVLGQTTVAYTDGSARTAADVMFAGNGVQRPDWVETALSNATVPSSAIATTMVPTPLVMNQTGTVTGPETTAVSASPTAATPSIEQQASTFVQMATTQDMPTTPLGFVDAHQMTVGTDAVAVTDEPAVPVPQPPASTGISTSTPALV